MVNGTGLRCSLCLGRGEGCGGGGVLKQCFTYDARLGGFFDSLHMGPNLTKILLLVPNVCCFFYDLFTPTWCLNMYDQVCDVQFWVPFNCETNTHNNRFLNHLLLLTMGIRCALPGNVQYQM